MATPNVDTREFLSQTKFYDGYSRFKEYGNGGYESWNEAVDRVMEMHLDNYEESNGKLQDFIEEASEVGAPKYMEWYGVFGLLVTLIWLYLEILRLLAKLNSRRN